MPSITRALQWSVALSTTAIVLAAGLATYALSAGALRRQADDALLARAHAFAALVVEEVPDPEEDDPGGLVLDYKGPLDEPELGVFVRITTDDGAVLAESPGFPAVDWDGPGVRVHVYNLVTRATLADGSAARVGRVVEMARAELDSDDPEPGAYPFGTLVDSTEVITVEVATRAAPLDEALHAVLVAVVLGAVLAAAGCTIAATLAIARGLRPIAALSRAVDGVDAAHPAPLTLDEAPPAELAPIARAIDALLTRVRGAIAREQRFTDAAAHELRTPLAELRSVCEVAGRFPDQDRRARAVEQSHAIALEMAALLDALLLAARDGRAPADALEGVPLAPIVRAAIARARRGPAGEGVGPGSADADQGSAAESHAGDDANVLVAVPDAASWRATPAGARLIVGNLVANALAYTPGGGTVSVEATQGEAGWTLTVANGPVSLTAEEAAHAFEPFWRADPSRTDREHLGLGLSVVAAQAASLGLCATATVTAAGRFVVTVAPAG